MKITILTDNTAGPKFIATHGFSCYIESDINILFDTGPDNTFLENAKRLNLEINPDFVVLSHGHWDHGDGLSYLKFSHKLVCHPECFRKRYSKEKHRYVGLALTREQASESFQLIESAKAVKLSDKIYYLGEIPRSNNFEAQHTDFIDEQGNEDYIADDSALAIISDMGLIVISGCAHAGICNTIEYAKMITGVTDIHAVFGGFHLKSQGSQTKETIKYLQSNEIQKAFPSHCTSLPALAEFYTVFKLPQVLTGNYYTF
jgi:7,8-dihydropterin-6-yl-methyl-4-(beta-D-ribofuranosyl)aminobenzene 5'-phosphate synthase